VASVSFVFVVPDRHRQRLSLADQNQKFLAASAIRVSQIVSFNRRAMSSWDLG
jgi:hypothetical protein